jgi:excisionase family DNA binding protein
MSMKEVATYVGVSRRTVSDWIAEGRLEALKLGDSRTATVRIRPAALEEFLDSRRMRPTRSTGFTSPEAVA